jgi:hypothetical protein
MYSWWIFVAAPLGSTWCGHIDSGLWFFVTALLFVGVGPLRQVGCRVLRCVKLGKVGPAIVLAAW